MCNTPQGPSANAVAHANMHSHNTHLHTHTRARTGTQGDTLGHEHFVYESGRMVSAHRITLCVRVFVCVCLFWLLVCTSLLLPSRPQDPGLKEALKARVLGDLRDESGGRRTHTRTHTHAHAHAHTHTYTHAHTHTGVRAHTHMRQTPTQRCTLLRCSHLHVPQAWRLNNNGYALVPPPRPTL